MERNRENEVALRLAPKNDEAQKEPKTEKGSVHRYFNEYCNSTSIHGLKYLAESRSIGEKFLWILLITCSLSTCMYLISEIYIKFQASPVIVSFATKETPIYNIPFPAVTICPMNLAKKSVFNFTEVMRKIKKNEKVTEQEKRYAKYMAVVCDYGNGIFSEELTFTEDIFVALDELKISMSETLINCAFMGIPASCEEFFVPVIVDRSICYTMNILDRDLIFNENVVHFSNYNYVDKPYTGWTIDQGYGETKKNRDTFHDYPYRAFLAGADNALEITLFQNSSDNEYLCMQDEQGFRVALHAPFAVPLVNKLFFNVAQDRSVMAYIEPKVILTTDKVKRFSPKTRECYFSTEKKLKYFKIYTPKNCKLECFTNTLETCGCVGYYMPRENGTPICGNANVSCLKDAELDLKFDELQRQIEDGQDDFYCDCKPLCTDITYNTELSSSPWEYQKQMKAIYLDDRVQYDESAHFSKLLVFFKQDSFLTSERNELYGPTDFLANFGGLLGLFTGFSLLSAAEIIYFLTVRMCCNFRLFHLWTGRNNE